MTKLNEHFNTRNTMDMIVIGNILARFNAEYSDNMDVKYH